MTALDDLRGASKYRRSVVSSKIFAVFPTRAPEAAPGLGVARLVRHSRPPRADGRRPPRVRSRGARRGRAPARALRPRVRRRVLSLGRLAVRHRRGGRACRACGATRRARDRRARAGVASHGACRGHRDEVVRVAWHPERSSRPGPRTAPRACGASRSPAPQARPRTIPTRARSRAWTSSADTPRRCTGARSSATAPAAGPCSRPRPGPTSGAGPRERQGRQTAPSPRATRDGPGRPAEARPRARPRTKTKTNAAARSSGAPRRPRYLMSLASDAGARGLLASACTDGSVKVWALDSPAARRPDRVAPVARRRDGRRHRLRLRRRRPRLRGLRRRRVRDGRANAADQTPPRGVYGICAAPNGVPWVAVRRRRRREAAPAEAAGGDRTVALAVADPPAKTPRGGDVLRDRRERTDARRRRGVGAGGGGRGPRGPAGTLERARGTFFDEAEVGGGGAVRGEEEKRARRRTRSRGPATRRREREKS